MGRSVRFLTISAALLAFVAGPLRAEKEFSESVDVSLVEVPVQVLVDGEPVRGLGKQNFRVYEGRRSCPIQSLDVVDLALYQGSPDSPEKSLPIAARRRFLFLFDLSNMEVSSLERARDAALQLSRNGLHPTDLAAVATFSDAYGARLVLGFTPNREQLELALETLGVPQLLDRTPDPLGLLLGEARMDMVTMMDKTVNSNRRDVRTARAAAALGITEERAGEERRKNENEQRTRISDLSDAFGEMAETLAYAEGRKYVVLLSEGFDTSLVFAATKETDAAASAEKGEIWNVDSDRSFGSTALQNDLNRMIEAFRRSDCTIQSIDVGGLRDGSALSRGEQGRDGLFFVANETGGELFERFNDLGDAMSKMLERTSVTYLLTFQPRHTEADGSYHPIKVELVGGPKGARILHRPGYFSAQPYAFRGALERKFELADRVIEGRDGGTIEASIVAVALPGEGGKARVPFVIEVPGGPLLRKHLGKLLNAEIYLYALDEQGSAQAFLSQMVGLNLLKLEATLQGAGLKFFGDLELAPGHYALRTLVQNQQAGTFGLHSTEIDVPDFADGELHLQPAMLLEPAGDWILAREESAAEYPFVVGEETLFPATALRNLGSEPMVVWWTAFNLREGPLQFRGYLRDEADQARPFAGGIDRLDDEEGSSGRWVTRIDPSRLPSGLYDLEISLASGDRSATSVAHYLRPN